MQPAICDETQETSSDTPYRVADRIACVLAARTKMNPHRAADLVSAILEREEN